MCNKKRIDKNLKMICDCAEPDRIKQFRRSGFNAQPVKKYPGSVNSQIDDLKRFDNIYINTTCVNTWKEAKTWMWKQNKEGKYIDEPCDFFDDAMACLRYSTDLFERNKADAIIKLPL